MRRRAKKRARTSQFEREMELAILVSLETAKQEQSQRLADIDPVPELPIEFLKESAKTDEIENQKYANLKVEHSPTDEIRIKAPDPTSAVPSPESITEVENPIIITELSSQNELESTETPQPEPQESDQSRQTETIQPPKFLISQEQNIFLHQQLPNIENKSSPLPATSQAIEKPTITPVEELFGLEDDFGDVDSKSAIESLPKDTQNNEDSDVVDHHFFDETPNMEHQSLDSPLASPLDEKHSEQTPPISAPDTSDAECDFCGENYAIRHESPEKEQISDEVPKLCDVFQLPQLLTDTETEPDESLNEFFIVTPQQPEKVSEQVCESASSSISESTSENEPESSEESEPVDSIQEEIPNLPPISDSEMFTKFDLENRDVAKSPQTHHLDSQVCRSTAESNDETRQADRRASLFMGAFAMSIERAQHSVVIWILGLVKDQIPPQYAKLREFIGLLLAVPVVKFENIVSLIVHLDGRDIRFLRDLILTSPNPTVRTWGEKCEEIASSMEGRCNPSSDVHFESCREASSIVSRHEQPRKQMVMSIEKERAVLMNLVKEMTNPENMFVADSDSHGRSVHPARICYQPLSKPDEMAAVISSQVSYGLIHMVNSLRSNPAPQFYSVVETHIPAYLQSTSHIPGTKKRGRSRRHDTLTSGEQVQDEVKEEETPEDVTNDSDPENETEDIDDESVAPRCIDYQHPFQAFSEYFSGSIE